MQIFSHINPFKEKILLLEKDNRDKIKKTFKVNQDIADFAHNINENLSIWIVDKLFEQLIQERHFTRDQVITFLNTSDNDKNNYLEVFQDKVVSVLDYYANPEGKRDYPSFDDFKKERFDILYNKSDVWHKGLKSLSKKTTEIIDTEPNIEILKRYEADSNGNIYYWADLHKKNSEIESSRMGHCGNTSKGTTLLSLRSFTPSLNDSYISKSHITISVNRNKKYYTQCKGKQNRKPAIQYTPYIFDLFLFDNDIQSYESEYASGSDFTPIDLSSSQLTQLRQVKPKLVNQFVSVSAKEIEDDALSLTPEELFDKYFTEGFVLDTNNFSKFKTSTGYLPKDKAMSFIMNIILPVLIKDSSVFEKVVSYITTKESPTEFLITNSIIEYCIFTNNFNKIKNHINELFQEKQWSLNFDTYQDINIKYKNNICFFANFAELYPDYFTTYAYKKIEPLLDNLITDKNTLKDIENHLNLSTKNLVMSYISKYKDTEKIKDVYYVVIFDNLYDYSMEDIEKATSYRNEDYVSLENLNTDGYEQLVFKIQETNQLLKNNINYDKYQELIRDHLFANASFLSYTILGLYVKNPELLDYSIYDNYDPDFLNKDFGEVEVSLENLNAFDYYRGTNIASFSDELEDVFTRYEYDVYEDEIKDFLNDVSDRSSVSSKPNYKQTISLIKEKISSLTNKSFEELTEEYKEENDNDRRYRFYDIYQYIKDNYDIEELNDSIINSISGAYTSKIEDKIYEEMKSKVIDLFEDELKLNIDKNKVYLHEDKVYVTTNIREIVNFYVDKIDYLANYTDIDFEDSIDNLISNYIHGVIYDMDKIHINTDFGNVYTSFDDICEYFINY
jgi:hypothetical protein